MYLLYVWEAGPWRNDEARQKSGAAVTHLSFIWEGPSSSLLFWEGSSVNLIWPSKQMQELYSPII
jgi:hypothetical protein